MPSTGRRLLVVEDEPGLRRLVAEILNRRGYRVWVAADGRVAYHRDYWDAAEEVYEKIPLLGGLLRWIKRRLQV